MMVVENILKGIRDRRQHGEQNAVETFEWDSNPAKNDLSIRHRFDIVLVDVLSMSITYRLLC